MSNRSIGRRSRSLYSPDKSASMKLQLPEQIKTIASHLKLAASVAEGEVAPEGGAPLEAQRHLA